MPRIKRKVNDHQVTGIEKSLTSTNNLIVIQVGTIPICGKLTI